MNIKDTLEYIHSVKWQGSKPGLSRTRELLKALGNPEKKLRFVHIAGTNGKGSTSSCIVSVLQAAGYKTGLYTSPYIMSFNERIQVGGAQITDDELIILTEKLKPIVEAMKDPPTEFEIITALAMTYFWDCSCEIVVLEVGMGGELDSTNVIETPELAVITAIDYDHTEYLGTTLPEIARAKAGIIKSGGDVLIYGGSIEVEEVFRSVAAERNARLNKADFSRIKNTSYSLENTKLNIEPYGEILLPLAGAYQPSNALVAVTACELLRDKGYKISDTSIADGIGAVKWQARFEFLGYDPVFILDAAHNPHGAKAVTESLKAYFGEQKVIFIMGVLADKDVKTMVELIIPAAEYVFTVTPNNTRAMKAARLAELISCHGVPTTACGGIGEGVEKAFDMAGKRANRDSTGNSGTCADGTDSNSTDSNGKPIICAIGSLYLAADIKAAYEKHTASS